MHGLSTMSLNVNLPNAFDTSAILGKSITMDRTLDMNFMDDVSLSTEHIGAQLPTTEIAAEATSPNLVQSSSSNTLFDTSVFPSSIFECLHEGYYDEEPGSHDHSSSASSPISMLDDDNLESTSPHDPSSPSTAVPRSTQSTATKSSRSGRKTASNKREPIADDYSDEEEFKRAWAKWRDDRDHNNMSVKRSRQRAKLRKLEAMKNAQQTTTTKSKVTKANTEVSSTVTLSRQDFLLLARLVKHQSVSELDTKRAHALVDMYSSEYDSALKAKSGTKSRR